METVIDIAEIATPILLLFFTARFEVARRREERWRDIEMRLHEDRIAIYNSILEPFVILFSSKGSLPDKPKFKSKKYKSMTNQAVAVEILLSAEYRDTGFKLALFGSDGVVRSYYRLQQNAFRHAEGNIASDKMLLVDLLGNFLLEIRRSVGNETTKIKNYELLGWFIKDIETVINKENGE
ncbi:MAG: hypothetical protein OXF22_08600 [Anaerolineaceae bacterium]|nr:hypothetical protein [Anaerolineaceae bacterium]